MKSRQKKTHIMRLLFPYGLRYDISRLLLTIAYFEIRSPDRFPPAPLSPPAFSPRQSQKYILVAAWQVNKRIHQSTARRRHTKVTMWVAPGPRSLDLGFPDPGLQNPRRKPEKGESICTSRTKYNFRHHKTTRGLEGALEEIGRILSPRYTHTSGWIKKGFFNSWSSWDKYVSI